MSGSILGTLALGFALGVRHSLDGDHLVAISTVVGRGRSLWRSSLVGVMWGVGHTTSLFAAAIAVILLRLTISPRTALSIEFGVGLMLILLGLDLLRRLARGDLQVHSDTHHHEGDEHAHLHAHLHAHAERIERARSHHPVGGRPFTIGLVHGLAGSAALMLYVLTTISSPSIAILYVLIFGIGTIGGMLVMSSLIGLPFVLALRLAPRAASAIHLVTAFGSVGFGMLYAWRVGWVEGLFR